MILLTLFFKDQEWTYLLFFIKKVNILKMAKNKNF